MNLPARVLSATLRRARRLPRATLTRRPFDYAPHRKRETQPAVLANRAGFLPSGGARPSPTEFERLMGTNDLVDEFSGHAEEAGEPHRAREVLDEVPPGRSGLAWKPRVKLGTIFPV